MNQIEKDIILGFATQKISKKQLDVLLPKYVNDESLINAYIDVINDIDSEGLQYLNMLIPEDIFRHINIKRKLLIENWHNTHEDLVGYFQLIFNNDAENIVYLEKALHNLPVYLTPEDFKYPYIRKIIYAIGAQPEPYNIEALDKLAKQTNDEHIKQLALHQIEKRKRLGRWESESNSKNAEL